MAKERRKIEQLKFLCEQRIRPYFTDEYVKMYVGCNPNLKSRWIP